ncbi:MAG: hypothetical protein H0X33_10175 [Taibaiella sp.]|nr:hypothetical protein [Taibaiella sp.]
MRKIIFILFIFNQAYGQEISSCHIYNTLYFGGTTNMMRDRFKQLSSKPVDSTYGYTFNEHEIKELQNILHYSRKRKLMPMKMAALFFEGVFFDNKNKAHQYVVDQECLYDFSDNIIYSFKTQNSIGFIYQLCDKLPYWNRLNRKDTL